MVILQLLSIKVNSEKNDWYVMLDGILTDMFFISHVLISTRKCVTHSWDSNDIISLFKFPPPFVLHWPFHLHNYHLIAMPHRTPLMLACTKERKKMVEVLVGYGASLSLKNKDGWTPFHIACREGHPDIVHFLLDTSPSCWEMVSKNGRTPLHSAGMKIKENTYNRIWSQSGMIIYITDNTANIIV